MLPAAVHSVSLCAPLITPSQLPHLLPGPFCKQKARLYLFLFLHKEDELRKKESCPRKTRREENPCPVPVTEDVIVRRCCLSVHTHPWALLTSESLAR